MFAPLHGVSAIERDEPDGDSRNHQKGSDNPEQIHRVFLTNAG